MISSSGSSRSVKRKAEASAALTLTVSSPGECWTRVFDFCGILEEYQGGISNGRIQSIIIVGKCCTI